MNNQDRLAALQQEIHVWMAWPDRVDPLQLTRQYQPLLSPDELERYQRFYFEADRLNYLAAHALLRLVLSRYVPYVPGQWRFLRGAYGKPQIDPALTSAPLNFNLSHTKGLVACVLAVDRDCGIDVESIRPMKDMHGVAGTVFSEQEIAFLNAQPAAAQQSAFFSLWTLKEAYIKATGMGMTAPLQQITFDMQAPQLCVHDRNAAPHHGNDWLFDSCIPADSHRLAVAANRTDALERIVYHELDLADGSHYSFSRNFSIIAGT